ncbi:MAG: hypothetical protein ACXU8N_09200 [Telluria sp.]
MKFKTKKVLISAAIALSALGAAHAVHAAIDRAHIIYYYADANMEDLVGMGGHGCNAGISWGQKTAYYEIEDFDCYSAGSGGSQ